MRILLLRLLIAWWFIPFCWTVLWGVLWLTSGGRAAIEAVSHVTTDLWRGTL